MTTTINPKFLDLDLDREAKRIGRETGDLNNLDSLMGAAPEFSDTEFPPFSEAEMREHAAAQKAAGGSLPRKATLWVHDQNGDPSCTSNAALELWEERFVIQFGRQQCPKMSAMSLYNRVGAPRSGSSLEANVREMCERGALPLDDPENRARFKHTKAHNGYSRNPAGWEETAKDFRFDPENIYRLTSGDPQQFRTAQMRGFGIMYARDGHCILAKQWIFENGVWANEYLNSWSINWGNKGFGYDSDRKMARCSWGFAVKQILTPSWLQL